MLRRIALLLLVLIACLAQRGDAALDPLSVRAMICQKEGRDVCGNRRAKVLIEPVRIRIEVYLAQHPDNKDIVYGVACAGEDEPRTISGPYSLELTPPMMFVEYPDVRAGTCYGFAALLRRDGSILRDTDGPLLIQPRHEG